MTETKTLTIGNIRAAKPAAEPYFISDSRQPGLRLWVGTGGKKSFLVRGRFDGRSISTRTIREVDANNLTEGSLQRAREIAAEWLSQLRTGKDPRKELNALRDARRAELSNTFESVMDRYLAAKTKRGRRQAEKDRQEFRYNCSHWMNKPIGSITKADIKKVMATIDERGAQRQAHNVFVKIRALLNWALREELIDRNPAKSIAPAEELGEKVSRDRLLDDRELRAFILACRSMPAHLGLSYGRAMEMMLQTGCRHTEITEAEWSEFSASKARLTIPAHRTKMGRQRVVHLNERAMEIIRDQPRIAGCPYIFTTTGRVPIHVGSKVKAMLDRRMVELMTLWNRDVSVELRPYVLHDLRRVFSTRLFDDLHVDPTLIKVLIGHKIDGVLGVYLRTTGGEARAPEVMAAWGKYLANIARDWNDQGLGSNVPPIRA